MSVAVRVALSALLLVPFAGCGGGGKKNKAPEPIIVDPHEASTHFPSVNVDFDGRATDPEDGPVPGTALRWEVRNAQGAVIFASPGASVTAAFPVAGTYTVILFAMDSEGKEGRATTTFKVGNTIAELTNPDNYGFIGISTPFNLDGDAATIAPATTISMMTFIGRNRETNAVVFNLQVAASVAICNPGLTICSTTVTPSVPAGPYHLKLEVTTSNAAEVAEDNLYVIADSPPVVAITSPVDGSRIAPGASVSFTGTATDPGGGPLVTRWTSSLAGQIGTSLSFTRSDLAMAKHNITLTATDENGQSASATVDLYIEDSGNPLLVNNTTITDVFALAFDSDVIWAARGVGRVASLTTAALAAANDVVTPNGDPAVAAIRLASGERLFGLQGSTIGSLPAGPAPGAVANENPAGMDGNVNDIAQAVTGNLFFATDAGLTYTDANRAVIGNYTGPAPLGSNPSFAVAVGADGTAWVGTDGDGLLRVTGVGGTPAVTSITPAQGLAGDVVYDVAVAADGKIWAGCDGGLSVFDPVANTVVTYDRGLPNDQIHAVALDANGVVWLGTEDGAVRLDTANDRLTIFDAADLTSRFVEDIVIDGSGDKYFGARAAGGQPGGVTRYIGE